MSTMSSTHGSPISKKSSALSAAFMMAKSLPPIAHYPAKIAPKLVAIEEVETFFSGKKILNSLSNFAPYPVQLFDINYMCGENAFHAAKFIIVAEHIKESKLERAEQMRNFAQQFSAPDLKPNEAKRLGRKGFILAQLELDIWSQKCLDIQREISMYKMNHYAKVRDDLISSKNKVLVHTAMRCNEEKAKFCFWEGKAIIKDGQLIILGQNHLGKIWMECRLLLKL